MPYSYSRSSYPSSSSYTPAMGVVKFRNTNKVAIFVSEGNTSPYKCAIRFIDLSTLSEYASAYVPAMASPSSAIRECHSFATPNGTYGFLVHHDHSNYKTNFFDIFIVSEDGSVLNASKNTVKDGYSSPSYRYTVLSDTEIALAWEWTHTYTNEVYIYNK